jgi:hypothetical protein
MLFREPMNEWIPRGRAQWISQFADAVVFFRFDPESPESEKLTDSVSEKEEKDIDESELDTKVDQDCTEYCGSGFARIKTLGEIQVQVGEWYSVKSYFVRVRTFYLINNLSVT